MIWNRLVGISSSDPEGEDEALVHGGKGSVGGESFFDTVQTLIEKASGPEKSELCWIMNFLRLTSTFWVKEPEIDAPVRLWVRKVDCSDHIWPFRHLLGKLLTTPMGPVPSTLLDKAGAVAGTGENVSTANGMTVPLPEEVSYDCLPDWAAQHFNGRVTLDPRALRALEDAQFDDIELAYRSVELLGTRYWQMRTRVRTPMVRAGNTPLHSSAFSLKTRRRHRNQPWVWDATRSSCNGTNAG